MALIFKGVGGPCPDSPIVQTGGCWTPEVPVPCVCPGLGVLEESYTVSGLDVGTGDWFPSGPSDTTGAPVDPVWNGIVTWNDALHGPCVWVDFETFASNNGYRLDGRWLELINPGGGEDCYWQFGVQMFYANSGIGAGEMLWRKRHGTTPVGTYTLEVDNTDVRLTPPGETVTVS